MGNLRQLAAAGLLLIAGIASAETTMTMEGPFVSIGDYISNGTGVLEKRWRYDITNTSSSGDVNNMISFQINAGTNNDILSMAKNYSGTGTITLDLTDTIAGFTGLLPPPSGGLINRVAIVFYTPATTTSAPGLAVATAFGWSLGGDNFPSVAVAIPYLPAGLSMESGSQEADGQHEFRYRLGNPGTPAISTLTIAAGMQQGVSDTQAPPGWTATVTPLATTFTGTLDHGRNALFLLRCPLPPGDPLLASASAEGGTILTAPAAVPGSSLPRPLATWMDATGFHAPFLVRPGTTVRPSHSSDLSDWSDASAPFTMPVTTNVLQLDHSVAGPALFLRLKSEAPTATESTDLLTLPVDGPWTDAGPPQPEAPVGTPVQLPCRKDGRAPPLLTAP